MRHTLREWNAVLASGARARLGGLALAALCVAAATAPLSAAAAQQSASPAAPADQGWPRVFTNGDQKVVLYQPQIDKWPEFQQIEMRLAVAVTPSGAKEPSYGIVTVQANTSVDYGTRTVLVQSPQRSVHFPNVPADQVPALEAELQQVVPPQASMVVSLDRALACMQPASAAAAGVQANLNPPTIFYSTQPAILLSFMGPPKFKPIQGTLLLCAINANWDVFLDENSGSYFLLDGSNGNTWLTSPDPVAGPWTTATSVPQSFANLPAGDQWSHVLAALPPAGSAPPATAVRVFTSTRPAELIVVNGTPAFEPIIGTQLLAVSNTDSALFQQMPGNTWYYLVAGRWFSAPAPGGPWTAATTSLPPDFANIPADSAFAYVRDSVPGTQAASDAVMLASVPRMATVQRDAVSLTVSYIGEPKFAPIPPTALSYALNTSDSVLQADGAYYCCRQAVWFTASDAQGPWTVAAQVPADIYTIPSTSPMYPVTFVRVYGSTPDSVTFGYTSGYDGEYVGQTGTLLYGLGETSSPGNSDASSSSSTADGSSGGSSSEDDAYWGSYYQCGPAWYSYGYGACYGGYTNGCYYYGGPAYGPYVGAARSTIYNPVTGGWASTGYRYSPYGAAGYTAHYNPATGNTVARGGVTTAYGSWTRGVVTNGDAWARGGTHSTAAATTGWAQTSSGAEAAGVKTANNGAFVAKGPEGNVYAGADGNVYKQNSDGSWSQHNGNSWAQPAWGAQAQAAQPRPQQNAGGAGGWNGGNAGGGGFGGGGNAGGQSMQQNLDQQAGARQWGGYRAGGGGGGFRGRR